MSIVFYLHSSFTALKILCVPPIHPSCPNCSHLFLLCFPSFFPYLQNAINTVVLEALGGLRFEEENLGMTGRES